MDRTASKRSQFLDDESDGSLDTAVRGRLAVLPRQGTRRPQIGIERMLRIYFLQPWFILADLACEEAICDSGI